jgi:glycogen debranching enzyme
MESSIKTIEKCYALSKDVIKKCTSAHGLFASGGKEGYDAIWARDSMITFLGASLVGNDDFKKTFRKSIETLSSHQSKNGQIPNAVDTYSKRRPHVDYASIDSSLWYLIGHDIFRKRYKDTSLLKKYNKNIKNALRWLSCQDTGEKGMLTQLPTSDWQDAFPHKYGYSLSTQALYFKVLNINNLIKGSKRLKYALNSNPETSLWNKNYYIAYRWKNHNKYKEVGNWFDTFGNLLAIIYGLADNSMAKLILDYIKSKKIHSPYPVRSIYPPIKRGSSYWQDYFMDCDARDPFRYLNGGIWPFIGGFYVLSLVKTKQYKLAKKMLISLANSNIKGKFPEWIHPKTKECFGSLQAWDAGMYILAYECVKKRKVLI